MLLAQCIWKYFIFYRKFQNENINTSGPNIPDKHFTLQRIHLINKNFDVPFFTQEEVTELLIMRETDIWQVFEQKVKEKIFEITAGQQGLVNDAAY